MSVYATSIRQLSQAADAANIAYSLERISSSEVDRYRAFFPLDVISEIMRNGYIGGMEIPWIVEDLYVYSLSDIAAKQKGYDFNAHSASYSHDPQGLLSVIGDWNGDPIAVDQHGSLWTARHGQGAWAFKELSDSLAQFYEVMSAWVRYFVLARGKNVLDENYELPVSERNTLEQEVLGSLPDKYKSGFWSILGV